MSDFEKTLETDEPATAPERSLGALFARVALGIDLNAPPPPEGTAPDLQTPSLIDPAFKQDFADGGELRLGLINPLGSALESRFDDISQQTADPFINALNSGGAAQLLGAGYERDNIPLGPGMLSVEGSVGYSMREQGLAADIGAGYEMTKNDWALSAEAQVTAMLEQNSAYAQANILAEKTFSSADTDRPDMRVSMGANMAAAFNGAAQDGDSLSANAFAEIHTRLSVNPDSWTSNLSAVFGAYAGTQGAGVYGAALHDVPAIMGMDTDAAIGPSVTVDNNNGTTLGFMLRKSL